jgi:hypothetical protein
MEDEILPGDKIVFMSGSEPTSREVLDAMLAANYQVVTVRPGVHGRTQGALAPYKPTNPERDAWNAAVDAKKAEKKAKKGLK